MLVAKHNATQTATQHQGGGDRPTTQAIQDEHNGYVAGELHQTHDEQDQVGIAVQLSGTQ